MQNQLVFNSQRDTEYSHVDSRFNRVMHVFDANWHGIRNASGATPGHKLAIDHRHRLDSLDFRYVFGLVYQYGLEKVVFQGYSETASQLCVALKREFGDRLDCNVITHVTTAQFDHYFEVEMQKLIMRQVGSGYISRHGSVKPDLHRVFNWVWPKTIYNYYPNSGRLESATYSGEADSGSGTVFISLENTFRKNLYTNTIAALSSPEVGRVLSVNEPSGLADLFSVNRLRVIGFQKRAAMMNIMARCDLALNVTFAECQPMTQLEALAVGTPCLTGDLNLEELADLDASKWFTVKTCDNPRFLTERIDDVLRMKRLEPTKIDAAVSAYQERVLKIAASSYLDFLYG